jgi:hypothetical protein
MTATTTAMKTKSQDQMLRDHGYYAYACSAGGKYALHAVGQESPASYRGTFKTKKAAIEAAMKLPKITAPA